MSATGSVDRRDGRDKLQRATSLNLGEHFVDDRLIGESGLEMTTVPLPRCSSMRMTASVELAPSGIGTKWCLLSSAFVAAAISSIEISRSDQDS